jgi:hypothetical protein
MIHSVPEPHDSVSTTPFFWSEILFVPWVSAAGLTCRLLFWWVGLLLQGHKLRWQLLPPSVYSMCCGTSCDLAFPLFKPHYPLSSQALRTFSENWLWLKGTESWEKLGIAEVIRDCIRPTPFLFLFDHKKTTSGALYLRHILVRACKLRTFESEGRGGRRG